MSIRFQVPIEVVNQGAYHDIVSPPTGSFCSLFHQFLACRLTLRIQGLLYDIDNGPGTLFALQIVLDKIGVAI